MKESDTKHEESEGVSLFEKWKNGLISTEEMNESFRKLSKKHIDDVMSQDFSKRQNIFDYRAGLMDAMTLVSDANYELFANKNVPSEIKFAVSDCVSAICEAINSLYRLSLMAE